MQTSKPSRANPKAVRNLASKAQTDVGLQKKIPMRAINFFAAYFSLQSCLPTFANLLHRPRTMLLGSLSMVEEEEGKKKRFCLEECFFRSPKTNREPCFPPANSPWKRIGPFRRNRLYAKSEKRSREMSFGKCFAAPGKKGSSGSLGPQSQRL